MLGPIRSGSQLSAKAELQISHSVNFWEVNQAEVKFYE